VRVSAARLRARRPDPLARPEAPFSPPAREAAAPAPLPLEAR
jgi:hypothetical protein